MTLDRIEEQLEIEASWPTWVCGRMQRVRAHHASDAALIFAERLARRQFGDSGICGAVREDTTSGNWHRFSIYIGRRLRDGTISGHNEWLDVERL